MGVTWAAASALCASIRPFLPHLLRSCPPGCSPARIHSLRVRWEPTHHDHAAHCCPYGPRWHGHAAIAPQTSRLARGAHPLRRPTAGRAPQRASPCCCSSCHASCREGVGAVPSQQRRWRARLTRLVRKVWARGGGDGFCCVVVADLLSIYLLCLHPGGCV